ncbi:MAG: hypothetical protein CMP51_03865 [Flavobacteriales bacterium]|nr:hypothetical protein [Flavobacteriales bacterium]
MRIIFFVFLFTSSLFSQINDSRNINNLFKQGEYKKVVNICEKLVNYSNIQSYYNPYFNSLLNISAYDRATKINKQVTSKFRNNLTYKVDEYYLNIIKESSHANSILQDLQSKLLINTSQIISVANRFVLYQLYEEALSCYIFLEENYPNLPDYSMQIAHLYESLGNDQEMINRYLLSIKKEPNKRSMVIYYLQRYLDNNGIKNEDNFNYVRHGLLEYANVEKEGYFFSDILVWFFILDQEYELAFAQSKAIDLRNGLDGEKIYELGETLLDKKEYSVALKCFNYLISKGIDNYYYLEANINRLYSIENLEYFNIQNLKIQYEEAISLLGKDKFTATLLINYARFLTFKYQNIELSKSFLEEVMDIPQLYSRDLAELQLLYGDVMLLSGNIWTSLLYYSKVENIFTDHPLGHEAKLKKAKVSYYQGDFIWAQNQLDILKSSTSKLISNDAMSLSLLITDNLNLDTTENTMKMFARADLASFQKKYKKSNLILDSILIIYPEHDLVDEILFKKHEIYKELGEIASAISMLNRIIENYSFDILYDDALYSLAKIYDFNLNDKEMSLKYYQMILFNCSGSIFIVDSRKRYRILQDQF